MADANDKRNILLHQEGWGLTFLQDCKHASMCAWTYVLSMCAWTHVLNITQMYNGHEFEQTQGDGEGQGSLAYCSLWGHKELDTT